jgi:beta-glucosidase
LGLFDNPYVNPELVQSDFRLENERNLALQAAHETITLLKNENNLLPLNLKKDKSIAIIGPNADRILLGGYSGVPKYYTSVLQGIKEKVGSDVNVLYSEGCKITIGGSWNEDIVIPSDPEEDKKMILEAVEVAKKAEIVILALGGNEQTSREALNKTHLGDRPDLGLIGMQNELVRSMLEIGKTVIVLIFNGRPTSINYINDNVPAIVNCFYLGQETGRAVADVLFGDYNPSGKLPMSFPRSAGHLPCYYNYKPSARRGYLFDDITPLYSFGFGLSYTKFSFSNLRLEKSTIKCNESTKALIDIKNVGQREGTEVVQMYIHDCFSSVTRPVKELKGFKKIQLKPLETTTVELEILPEHLAFTNIDKKHIVEPGDFEIMVGNSSRSEDLEKVILQVL